jgi:hypothetical protein
LDEATAKAVPDLKTAVDQVNLGLTLVRQAWTFFSSACTNNTLQASEATGLQLAQTASDAFTSAKALVDAIRAKK